MHSTIPERLMILVALIQGLCLLILHQAMEFKFWPHQQPQWLFAFYSLALIGPTMYLLGAETRRQKKFLKWVLPFTVLCSLLGYYVGFQTVPLEYIRYQGILFGFVNTMVLATFMALIFSQQWVSQASLDYSGLFRLSWRNFLTLALSLLFALCTWGVLMLWAALFKAIDIRFFHELFTSEWFYYPAMALANGFGVLLFRRLSGVIDTITRIKQALMKFLLIILCFVSVIFLASLLVSGFSSLWDNGGSALILWMQALILFFVNAVYQEDPEIRPYPKFIHRFVFICVALLPVYSAIAFYGLSLRVEQYGWSMNRCWAYLIWFLLMAFALGYCWNILSKKDRWLAGLGKINIRLGIIFLALMLLINSPLVDFRKIVVSDQLARINSEELKVDELDLWYFKRELGRSGYMALQELKNKYGEKNPDLVKRIDNLYEDSSQALSEEELIGSIKVLAPEFPEDLKSRILEYENQSRWQARRVLDRYLLTVDANQNGQREYVLVKRLYDYQQWVVFYKKEAQWHNLSLSLLNDGKDFTAQELETLSPDQIETVSPEWLNIKIGEREFKVNDY